MRIKLKIWIKYSTMNTNIRYEYPMWAMILLTFLIVGEPVNFALAQDDKPLRLYLDIVCYQNEKGIDLNATVRARIGENQKIMPVEGLSLDFYTFNDSLELPLGTVMSNGDGVAKLAIERYNNLSWDEEEGYQFKVLFKGSDKFRKGSKSTSIRKAIINVKFVEIDSVKMILAEALEIDPQTREKIPLEGEAVSFYVKGSLSLYPIGEEDLEDGIARVNFPVTLPGDSLGNLTIIAKIEESDDYGFVEGSARKDWGMPREPAVTEKRRGLGDTDAPLWMVYTLIFLMSAVWIHYLYVFVVIYLIKKDSKTAT
jgi:hypothetical protein